MSDLRGEATQLLDVLIDRLHTTEELMSTPVRTAEPTDPPAPRVCATCGHDTRELSCSGCPLCALLAMVRGERPELTVKLVDSALVALKSIRGLLGEPDPAGSDRAKPQTATDDQPPADPGTRPQTPESPHIESQRIEPQYVEPQHIEIR